MSANSTCASCTEPVDCNVPMLRRTSLVHFVKWLVERDRQYRSLQKLRDLPDERLVDMGLDREGLYRAFQNQS